MSTFSQGDYAQLNGMGGPDEDINPANSGIPLVEGGNPAWNDYLQFVPEADRPAAAEKLKEWDKNYNSLRENYKPWEDLQKSGINPDQAKTALEIRNVIENQPQFVYDKLGEYLNISGKEAKKMVEETAAEEKPEGPGGQYTPEQLQALQEKVDTMAQLMVAQRQEEQKSEEAKKQEEAIDKELSDVKKKYGDFDEEEIVMRMVNKGLSAEDAYKEWDAKVTEYRKTRPAPVLMGGSGGQIPQRAIDPTKLDSKGTKSLVSQYLEHANAERNA